MELVMIFPYIYKEFNVLIKIIIGKTFLFLPTIKLNFLKNLK